MSRNIFVTGTGTDVGKTYVTGLIVKKLRKSGVDIPAGILTREELVDAIMKVK